MNSLPKKKLILIALSGITLIFLMWQLLYLISTAFFTKAVQPQISVLENVPVNSPEKNTKDNSAAGEQDKAYSALSDQYHYLQMEHKLLDEQVAVAKLRNELAQLNKQNTAIETTSKNLNPLETHYQLVYLSQENQRWTATIAFNNNYQSVQAGDQLDNGNKVLAIDQNGVTLLVDQQKLLLNFTDTKKVTDLAAEISQNVSEKIQSVQKTQTTLLEKKVDHTNQEISNLAEAEQRVYTGHLPSGADLPNNQNEPFTLDEILLLELPPKNYTIRVAQDGSLSDLKKLIAKFHLDPKAMLFHFRKNQQTEHVLIFGDFASKEQAEDALNSLPPSLLQLTPQIVTMSEVQQAIKVMH